MTTFQLDQCLDSIAQQLLKRFKVALPDWDQVVWSNSIVEITGIGAEVWHVEAGQLTPDAFVAFDVEDWQAKLREVLQRHAQQSQP